MFKPHLLFFIIGIGLLIFLLVKNNPKLLVLNTEKTIKQKQTLNSTPKTTSLPIEDTTPSPQSYSSKLHDYQYPQSKITYQDESSLLLESGDNANTITTWYENKIKSKGFNITSMVQNTVNDHILNKLIGADHASEVMIDIGKEANSSTTLIKVKTNINEKETTSNQFI